MNQTQKKTNKGSLSFYEVLSTKNELFKVSTDNDLYGTYVRMTSEGLVNERTGNIVPLSQELATSRFAPVQKAKPEPKELSIENVLTLYQQGAPIRIELEDVYRVIQKNPFPSSGIEARLNELFGLSLEENRMQAFSSSDVIAINELINAKFYLHEDEC